MKKIFTLLTLALVFLGVRNEASAFFGRKKSGENTIRIGATPVPHAEILEVVKGQLAEAGYDLDIVEFTDYVTPNISLNDGALDANFFQHKPYLEAFSADRGLDLAVAGKVHVEPLGLYSEKIKDLADLPVGATIAIPNDPSNGARALILLENAGLIGINPEAGLKATEFDITDNPKGLKFKALEAAQLPRVLRDVDAAIINGNYALESDLNPVEDSILLEGADSPYSNIVAVKAGNQTDPKIAALIRALQSQEVKEFILGKYSGGVVPAF